MSRAPLEPASRRLQIKRRSARAETELRLAEVLALNLEAEGSAWIDGAGWSMFPTSPPGSRLRVAARRGEPRVGEIVVFARGGRLVSHRLVRHAPEGWIPKGDGLPIEDAPLAEGQVLGVVTGIRLAGRSWDVGADERVAALSRTLGRPFAWAGSSRAAATLARPLYAVTATPILLWLMVLSWLRGKS